MINITQYSQHNIQIPLHSLILVSRFKQGDSETYSDRARYDEGWYERKTIEYISEEKNKFIYKKYSVHAREKKDGERERNGKRYRDGDNRNKDHFKSKIRQDK